MVLFVICEGRSVERGEAAAADIRKEVPAAVLRVMQLDLGSLKSVREFSRAFLALPVGEGKAAEEGETAAGSGEEVPLPPLKLLINNAGIMALPEYQTTPDGIECQWGTNHIGHFELTRQLLPRLKANQPSRVVNVSSSAHQMSPKWSADLVPPKAADYGAWRNYGVSKISNIWFTRHLNELNRGTGVSSYALHPGVIQTNLQQHMGSVTSTLLGLGSVFMKSIPQGAATTLFCALLAPPVVQCVKAESSEDVKGEDSAADETYFHADCAHAQKDATAAAKDPAAPRALWEISERVVAEAYTKLDAEDEAAPAAAAGGEGDGADESK